MNIGFFASHGGSNMQAILDAIHSGALDAQARVLICNNRKAFAVERAQQAGLPCAVLNSATHPDPDALDQAMLEVLRSYEVDRVVLAGYMRKIGPRVLKEYSGRILNIHPSLLPKFGGQGMFGRHVHEAVIAAAESVSGATVHAVTEEYDQGEILGQKKVDVYMDDTPETLAARVLKAEHALYVEVLAAQAAAAAARAGQSGHS